MPRAELFAIVEQQSANEMAAYIKEKEEETKANAGETAQNIIGIGHSEICSGRNH